MCRTAGIPVSNKCVLENGKKSYKGVFMFIVKTFISVIESILAIRKFNPDVVVGVGGYASVAPIIAARVATA